MTSFVAKFDLKVFSQSKATLIKVNIAIAVEKQPKDMKQQRALVICVFICLFLVDIRRTASLKVFQSGISFRSCQKLKPPKKSAKESQALYSRPNDNTESELKPKIPATNEGVPHSMLDNQKTTANKFASFGLSMLSALAMSRISKPSRANAIGTLYELKDQDMVLQGVSFNVQNTFKEAAMLNAAFVDTCRPIRSTSVNGVNETVLGFGSDAYVSPKTFIPGISTFAEDGGHATITIKSKQINDDGLIELYEPGNGLQFIKIGTDTLRISKAVENGADVKFAYGWVNWLSPNQIPYEITVGLTRDPLMLVCLRVKNLKESSDFFVNELGMKMLDYPLARAKDSQFEKPQPKNSVYVSYGPNSMGLLLVEDPIEIGGGDLDGNSNGVGGVLKKKNKSRPPPLVIGSILEVSYNLQTMNIWNIDTKIYRNIYIICAFALIFFPCHSFSLPYYIYIRIIPHMKMNTQTNRPFPS